MSRRTKIWLLVGAGYAALIVALFWRVFMRGQMAGWDSIEEYWPDLIFQADAYTSGELPLWNPYTFGGYSFYADPQASQLAPMNLLCVLVSPIIGTGPQLMTLKIIGLFYAAAWGMHLLVYGWTRCHAGAALAAVMFVAGGPVLVHKNGALLWPMLYLPWALLALDAFLARPSVVRGAVMGFALGAMGAAGHPQGFFFGVLVVLAYAGYRAIGGLAAARREGTAAVIRTARVLAPGLALGVVICGVYWWAVYGPASAVVDASDRGTRTLGWVLGNPLRRHELRELIVPTVDKNWQHDIYMGPLALVLVAWRAGFAWSGRLWCAVAVASVVLALGAHGHVLPFLAEHVPGFALFRIPYRYKLITGFACAAGAGLALAHAMTSVPRTEKLVLAGLGLVWLVLALAIGGANDALPAIGMASVIVVVLGALVVDRPRRRLYAAVLVALVTIDLVRAGDTKLAILQPTPDPDQGVAQIAALPGVDSEYRFWVGGRSSGRPGPIPFAAAYRAHVRELSGYEQPLTPSRAIDLVAAVEKTPALAAHFNTKYIARHGRQPFVTLPDVAPVVRVYPRADRVPEREHLARLRTLSPSALATALVDPASTSAPLPASDFAPVSGRVLARTHTSLALEVTAPAPGIAVINETFAPGWSATVDGIETPLFRANHMLTALVVPAGTHRIEFTFSATGYKAVLVLLFLFLVATVVLSIRSYIASRKNAAGDPVITSADQA